VGGRHHTHGVGRTLQEPLDVGGQQGALRLFGFGRGGLGLEAGREFRQLERGDGADLAVGRTRGQPHHAID
jgi:hypothetical protein